MKPVAGRSVDWIPPALMLAVGFASYDVATPGWTHQYTVADATFDPIFEE